jgi:cell division protein FtsQ
MVKTTTRPVETATRIPIDPKVKARRNAVARQKMLRRRYIVLSVASVLLVLALAAGSFLTPIFNVDHVHIRGESFLTAEQVLDGSRIRRGEPLIFVDAQDSAARIRQIPWVASARVKRVFPGTVRITITERVPYAYIESGPSQFSLIDANGRVLDTRQAQPDTLIRVDGVGSTPAPGRFLRDRSALDALLALPPGLRSLVKIATLTEGQLSFLLVDDLQLLFGDVANVAAKGAVAEAVIAQLSGGVRVVDVRVPSAPVSK